MKVLIGPSGAMECLASGTMDMEDPGSIVVFTDTIGASHLGREIVVPSS